MRCLKSVRVSLDVYDRGPWRILPERWATNGLRRLQVLDSFTVELPPVLPHHDQIYPGQSLATTMPMVVEKKHTESKKDEEKEGEEEQQTPATAPTPALAPASTLAPPCSPSPPFEIVRRPTLRYWEFSPWEVERFMWETQVDGDKLSCWITVPKEARRINNPYLPA
jgi:hypothetical protein